MQTIIISSDEKIVIMSRELESMSVTIVMAFLMKKYRLSVVEVLIQLQQKWNVVPHKKFSQHLNLWQYMNYRLKANEPLLRRVLLDWFRFEFESIESSDKNFEQMTKKFLKLGIDYIDTKDEIEESDPNLKRGLQYNCGKCDKQVLSGRNIIRNNVYFDCKFIFTEPISWVLQKTYKCAQIWQHFIHGQINCHSCNVLIGDYDWNPRTGCQCPLHRGLEKYSIYRFFAEKLKVKYNNKSIKK